MIYYNEVDPYAAQWLRNLMDAGLIPTGDVDERSIVDVEPGDVMGYRECHFFAGIGVWAYALRRAQWPVDRRIWTGSCPCQPFSMIGNQKGVEDERHLWPTWFSLIRQCEPDVVFGEQVASPAGRDWLDHVLSDLEEAGYSGGAVNLPAAGVGAPHIRQRLFFVGESFSTRLERYTRDVDGTTWVEGPRGSAAETGLPPYRLAHPGYSEQWKGGNPREEEEQGEGWVQSRTEPSGCSPTGGYWETAEWYPCSDDKWRPLEPGLVPLVDGSPTRVGRMRAYGNAIVAPLAQKMIEAYLDTHDDTVVRSAKTTAN